MVVVEAGNLLLEPLLQAAAFGWSPLARCDDVGDDDDAAGLGF